MKKLDKISNTAELTSLLASLIKIEKGKEYVKENFDRIKKLYLSTNKETQFFEEENTNIIDEAISIKIKNFFSFIRSLEGIREFEEEYLDYSYWANLYDSVKIPEVKKPDLKDLFKMSDLELREIRMAGEGKILKDFVFSSILLSDDKDSRQEKAIVLEHVADGKEYNFKSCGTSSLILQTGDKIVKLGLGRRKFDVPYHPRIMMPNFRKKYSDGSCLEVFNYGNTKSIDITDEKVLEIYKELESAGIIWGDASKQNLLVLTKDNDLPDFIESKEFNVFGFLEDSRFPTDNHIALKKGDIVVCDLDMLYVKGDPACHFGDLDDIVEDYIYMQKIKREDEEENSDKKRKTSEEDISFI